VNESGEFLIELSENFEKSYQKLIRDRYRKNRTAASEFSKLIEQFINIISVNPRPRPPFGHLEPWPKGSSYTEWELWKLEFKMPQLRGAVGQGRLIYLLNSTAKKIVIVWIYTHAEFEKRPPEKNLKRLLQEVIESSVISNETKPTESIKDSNTEIEEVTKEEPNSD
jgi:hypothetical protein